MSGPHGLNLTRSSWSHWTFRIITVITKHLFFYLKVVLSACTSIIYFLAIVARRIDQLESLRKTVSQGSNDLKLYNQIFFSTSMSFSHKIYASLKLMCENVILPNGLIINLMKYNGQELNNFVFCNCTFSSFSHRSTTKWCQLKIHIENTVC